MLANFFLKYAICQTLLQQMFRINKLAATVNA